jgi:hypothetical protein
MAAPSVVIGPGRALDAYSIRARLAPVFLVVLPPLLLCFSLVPGLPAWDKLWPLLGAAGVVILVDQLGRDGEGGFSRRYGPAGVAPRRQQLSGTAAPPIRSCSHASMSGSRQSWGTPCRPLTKSGRIRQEPITSTRQRSPS